MAMASGEHSAPLTGLGMMHQKPSKLLEEPAVLDDYSFSLNRLHSNDNVYNEICIDFENAGMFVQKVEYLNNIQLWKQYTMERERLLLRKPRDPNFSLNERYLYHGSSANKDFICEEGFDPRIAKQGCFGKGVYFSDSPKKCVKYSEKGDNPDTIILLARVILGHSKVYKTGKKNRSLLREPEKPEPYKGWKYYDSVEGCPRNHREFVVYDGRRALVEYVITYSRPTCRIPSNQPKSKFDRGVLLPANHNSSSQNPASDSEDSDSLVSDDGDSSSADSDPEPPTPTETADNSSRKSFLEKEQEEGQSLHAAVVDECECNREMWTSMSDSDKEEVITCLVESFLEIVELDENVSENCACARKFLIASELNLNHAIVAYYDAV